MHVMANLEQIEKGLIGCVSEPGKKPTSWSPLQENRYQGLGTSPR